MKTPSGCVKLGVILTLLLGALGLVAGCAFVFVGYSLRQQRQVRAQFAPPTVLVTDPASGVSAPAESYLGVSATAMGMSPIISVELWLDGELKETQSSDQPEGLSPFYANFGLLVPSEGSHMLFVRAVDANGVIGQSLPISVVGEPKSSQEFLAVTVQEGETLEGIANASATSPEILQALNPGLGSQPPTGTLVKVPLPPAEGPPASPSGPSPAPGSVPVEIPNIAMLQSASEKSPGLLPSGLFLPEPFAGKVGPPIAPTGLQAEVKGCKVMLRWNDHADTEDNYYVYMVPVNFHGFAVPIAYLKPSPSTGPAWHEFQPTVGGAVSLWVEAANSYGAQPSNVAWVYIPYDSGCPPTVAQDLDVTLLDMSVATTMDNAYCYVSFENNPEQRIPIQENVFLLLQDGKSHGPIGAAFFVIPIPKDDSLDLSGVCYGWSGDSFRELGSFSDSFPPGTWNGDRQTLRWNGHEIGLSVKPRTGWLTGTQVIGSTTDPTLPVPYDVLEEPWNVSTSPPSKLLRWKWDGDPKKIDRFEIFLNGKPYNYASADERAEHVQLPNECGNAVRWQVAARAGEALSYLSEPIQYDQPPCQRYLRVRFDEIYFKWTDDGFKIKGFPCETLSAYFHLSVRDVTRYFWGNGHFMPIKCGKPSFSTLTGGPGGPYTALYGPSPYEITIPLAPDEDVTAFWIRTRFWDDGDDPFGLHSEHPPIQASPYEKWPKCYETFTTGASTTDEAKSYLTFTLAV
ncbi:MAG: LysM domain-containing protein, partial [Anaerolineales bacterium]|nr:LysM domain-containing protein [Anaerolineales bacterium]